MNNDNIHLSFCDFPSEVWGVVFYCSYGCYHVGINKNLTFEIQQDVIQHEMYHIENDLCNTSRIVGIDMQHHIIEKEAAPALFFGQS